MSAATFSAWLVSMIRSTLSPNIGDKCFHAEVSAIERAADGKTSRVGLKSRRANVSQNNMTANSGLYPEEIRSENYRDRRYRHGRYRAHR